MRAFPAATFSALATSSVTEMAFSTDDAHPNAERFIQLSNARRTLLLHRLLHQFDSEVWHPSAAFAEDEDWWRDGRCVLCRSALLRWEKPARRPQHDSPGRWLVRYQRFPAKRHMQEVFLALVAPDGIYVHRHVGGSERLSSRGRTGGTQMQIYGPHHIRGWRAALELFILPKLESAGAAPLGVIGFEDTRLERLLGAAAPEAAAGERAFGRVNPTAAAFARVPLASRNPRARGIALETVVREVDARLHPLAVFDEAASADVAVAQPTERVQMARHWERDCSWRRNGRRIVCRSAQLRWQDGSDQRWRLQFGGVRLPVRDGAASPSRGLLGLDELLIALYTPRGLYVYRHDLSLGVTRTGGRRTAMDGFQVCLKGPKRESSWQAALDGAILPALDGSSCERLAFVDWSTDA